MKYKMIIFDADETLFDFSKSEKHALQNAMNDHDVDYKEEYHLPLYKKVNIGIWQEFERGEITREELKVGRFGRFLNAINNQCNALSFGDRFMHHLSQASFLYDGVEELVDVFSKTHRMVFVTNGLTRVQKHRVRESVIAHHFERIIISEEIGYTKPDPMIFTAGLKGMDLPSKSEIVIVGDSLTSDIPGGINYGIDTVWYNPNKNINNSPYTPTYEIYSLEELYDLL